MIAIAMIALIVWAFLLVRGVNEARQYGWLGSHGEQAASSFMSVQILFGTLLGLALQASVYGAFVPQSVAVAAFASRSAARWLLIVGLAGVALVSASSLLSRGISDARYVAARSVWPFGVIANVVGFVASVLGIIQFCSGH